ncbi:MAG: 50S ribosomal protein L23 [Candidatus Moranbacteria bacterium]|nr:50S ribosomal protein L23 [Candidatus Moranbacteria bacterium]
MALFGNTTEEKKPAQGGSASGGEKLLNKLPIKESPLATRILSRPRITEKSYALNALNQYVFVVSKTATKKSVKRAVEEAYAVQVEKVRIVRLPAKRRLFGKSIGMKSAIKKAIVSVAKGQSLELFKGGM